MKVYRRHSRLIFSLAVMSLYTIFVVFHVIAVVGGLGQISAIGLIARSDGALNVGLLRRLFVAVAGSLVVVLITGIAALWAGDWVYGRTGWMMASGVLFLGLGALQGIGSATLKRLALDPTNPAARAKLRTIALLMSTTLILLVVLMEGKPF